jgi:hypothetical protein
LTKLAGALCDMNSAEMTATPEATTKPGYLSQNSSAFGLGVVLVVAAFIPQATGLLAGWGNWKYALTAAGLIMLGTALLRVCPADTLLGISTCPAERR